MEHKKRYTFIPPHISMQLRYLHGRKWKTGPQLSRLYPQYSIRSIERHMVKTSSQTHDYAAICKEKQISLRLHTGYIQVTCQNLCSPYKLHQVTQVTQVTNLLKDKYFILKILVTCVTCVTCQDLLIFAHILPVTCL